MNKRFIHARYIQLLLVIFIQFYSQGLADNCVVAKVNGDLWDLDRPFEKDADLQLIKFEDKDGRL